MTASENCYARVFPKIITSRYPSRTLRDCRVFNKVGNASFLEPLETPGNATGDVAKLLVRSLTVVEAHTGCFTLAQIDCFTRTIDCFTLAQMGIWWLKALNCKGAFA